MAYLDINAFKKLKAFFWGLQTSSFNLNKIPTKDQDGTPIDKVYSLSLLRSFPQFQEEKFKDDNFLIRYLANPNNIAQILDQFTPSQQMELTKVLAEKPVATTHEPSLPSMPVPRPNFQAPKIPSEATNIAKNISSGSQIFINKNLNRIGRSLAQIAGGVGRNIGGPILNSSYQGLGRFGNGAINSFARLSNSSARLKSRAGSFRPTRSKKWLIIPGVAFLIFFFLSAVTGSPTGTTSTGEAAPINAGGTQNGLNYSLPLRNSSVVPLDIRDQIKASFPNSKLENWDVIIQKSKDAGWNPALVLALWIEESGAQGVAYDDPLGCAPGQPTTDINISLNCLFTNFSSYTNDQFAEFMARYSGGPAFDPFANNLNFTKNIKDWYLKLVPSGLGAITNIISNIGSCPAVGKISAPYGYNISDYPDVGNEGCGGLTKCHNGVDIAAIEGSLVKSPVAGTVTFAGSAEYKGNYLEITDSTGVIVTLEHLQNIIVSLNATVASGSIVGSVGRSGTGVTGPVLHYKISKNGILMNPFRTLGNSATLDSKVLSLSDDIAQNNYSNIRPDDPLGYWGECR